MSAEVFRMLWVVAVPALFGEVFWFSEYGGVNEKQDNMVWAVFLGPRVYLRKRRLYDRVREDTVVELPCMFCGFSAGGMAGEETG